MKSERPSDAPEGNGLGRLSALHWLHWLVLTSSLVVTITAWWFNKRQIEEKSEARFLREAEQIVALVTERMVKYEDGLWGGVGAILAHPDHERIRRRDWLEFTRKLQLEVKYPGINGIGIIHRVDRSALGDYLARYRRDRPDFRTHPEHDGDELLPITFIEPVEGNEQAVGLDMAHEVDRYTAAKKARDTGRAQITGPITLVQDATRTPGFLLFAPVYGGPCETVDERRASFRAMVYAPFVARKLMDGVLEKGRRSVGIRLRDGNELLYDEHVADESDHDPEPLYRRHSSVPLYGRTWEFDLRSGKSFRALAGSSQPVMILGGGLLIDGLLLVLFVVLARSNRRALAFARMSSEQAAVLAESNRELEQFAYVASHDLQEPLRMVTSFGRLLEKKTGPGLDADSRRFLDHMTGAAERMQNLVQDLLAYSHSDRDDRPIEAVDLNETVSSVLVDLDVAIREAGAKVEVGPLPTIDADGPGMHQLFQNLIGNGVKFRTVLPPHITVGADQTEDGLVLSVADNGIGIDPKFHERIFEPFKRLHLIEEFEGTGIGLAVCAKIVHRHGGTLTVDSEEGRGATFRIELPDNARDPEEAT